MKKLNTIFLFSLVSLMSFFVSDIQATNVVEPGVLQEQSPLKIKGCVKDAFGETMPGVNVVIKGSGKGTITDFDGNYMIMVEEGSELLFSFIGYTDRVVKVSNQHVIDIVLSENTQNLDEVLVVAYGTQKKATLTGAISSIGSEDLLKSPSSSVGNALAGALAGVSSVQYSGRPGGDDAQIFIRGVGSLTEGASAPLVLVDGVERPFSQLDPNEIENLTVLKDASATAVFGVRGANGVILVTTKRGSEGKTKINVSSSVGLQAPTRILESVDSYTYASAVNESQRNDGIPEDKLMFNEIALDAFKNNKYPIIYPNTNWTQKLLRKQTLQTQHNINISGGDKRVKYFSSIGYLFQDGLFRLSTPDYNGNFNYNRFNYRSNIDINVTNTTQMKLNIGGRYEGTNEPNTEDGMQHLWRNINWSTPMSGAGLVDGKYVKTANDMYVPMVLKDGLQPWYGRGYTNRVKNILNIDFIVSQKLDMLIKGLVVEAKASYDGNYNYVKTRSSSAEVYTPYFKCDVDKNAVGDSTIVYKVTGMNKELGYGESYGKSRSWYVEASLRYNQAFDKHNVSALLLYNQSKSYYPETFTEIPSGYVGMVGRLTYDYRSCYLLEFNVGYNGSENFVPGNTRYGLFPAFSGGWIITEEQFMRNQSCINYMKIRASVGLVGNDLLRIGNQAQRFLYLKDSYLTNGQGYNFGIEIPQKMPGVAEGTLGNQLVTWETSLKQNYGIDMTFLQQRLSLNVDLFYEKRSDILAKRTTVPGFVAADLPALNIGKVENKGYEVSVKWNDKIGDVRYWLTGNVSYAKNKIIYMDETRPNEPYMAMTGRPVGTPFGRKFYTFYSEGLTYEDGTPIADHSYQLKPGDAVYYDLNKDGQINTDDVCPIGYSNRPEYIFGLRYGVSYKGFDITMQWTGATNVSRVVGDIFRLPMGGDKYNRALFKYMYEDRWTPENATNANAPRLSGSGSTNNYVNSSLWVKDASYLKLKNVEIGYSFKVRQLKKIGIESLRFYANGYNLLTFDKLKFMDPESLSSNGGDYPLQKIYNVGINIQF